MALYQTDSASAADDEIENLRSSLEEVLDALKKTILVCAASGLNLRLCGSIFVHLLTSATVAPLLNYCILL
jgi:hypothetical protein